MIFTCPHLKWPFRANGYCFSNPTFLACVSVFGGLVNHWVLRTILHFHPRQFYFYLHLPTLIFSLISQFTHWSSISGEKTHTSGIPFTNTEKATWVASKTIGLYFITLLSVERVGSITIKPVMADWLKTFQNIFCCEIILSHSMNINKTLRIRDSARNCALTIHVSNKRIHLLKAKFSIYRCNKELTRKSLIQSCLW